MLDAAAELGSEKELEYVQMHDVAKRAGVAIGTLYRYFPSKTHLFVGVMADRTEQMAEAFARRPKDSADPQEAVFTLLMRASRALLRRPLLATAMIQSANAADVATVTDVTWIDNRFHEVLFDAMRVEHPTAEHDALARLLLQLWYGLLQSGLNGRISMSGFESDLRLACHLLLAPLSSSADQQAD